MSDAVQSVLRNTNDPDAFASWLGIANEPEEPVTSGLEDVGTAEANAEPPVEDQAEPDATADDGTPAEADTETAAEDKPDEPKPEPVTLPFEAIANDDAVDPALLAAMTVKFKADGKEIALPLTDVVRRAQSEPAAQRQARVNADRATQLEQTVAQKESEIESVRALALQILRDENVRLTLQAQLEEYDAPENRAQRAEQALAAERQRKQQEAQQVEFQNRLQQFAAEVVAPTVNEIIGKATLVSEKELLGEFVAGTAQWTVNGVIDPRYHQDVANYLRTEFAAYAANRQQEEEAKEQRIRSEARKTQMERQKLRNETAGAAKPTALTGAPSNAPPPPKRPKTLKDAERGALSALIGQ